MPTFYDCQRCTACCRWPGQVKLTEEEIKSITAFLGLDEHTFIQEYTRLNTTRSGLALKDKEDGSCVFLNGNQCSIQSAKPQQCRDFPNLWRFPGFEKRCHATPLEVDEATYREKILNATGRLPGTPEE